MAKSQKNNEIPTVATLLRNDEGEALERQGEGDLLGIMKGILTSFVGIA